MEKRFTVLIVICSFFLYLHAQSSDIKIVESILVKNNFHWNIDERVALEGNRIVALNLDNKDFSRKGITILTPEIGKLTELRSLTLNDNDLSKLPKNIFNCTKLVRLEIKNNDLMSIPPGISKLTSLKELDLRNNELDKLPSEIGRLKSIVKMQLWGNNLTMLPPEIGNLSTLKELYLMNNHLITLPESITRLKLTYFDIFFNYLRINSNSVDKWLKKYDYRYKDEQFIPYDGKHFL